MISDDGQIKSLSARWSGPSFWSPAIAKQGSVCALFHHRFEGKCLSWRKDSSGRVISLLIDYLGSQINLLGIYAPTNPAQRNSFCENLHECLIPASHRIISGDFNSYDTIASCNLSSLRPCCFSDHDLVDRVVDLSIFLPQGLGLWKFNNSLFTDAVFCDHISNRNTDLAGCFARFSSFKDWWEFFKLSLKKECIDFARDKR